jgi:ribosomal protein S18 acetylase RimI-like enzyme
MASTTTTITKKGPFNKWFDRQAARATDALYRTSFGSGVSRRAVRVLGVRHVLFITAGDDEPAAAMMLSQQEASVAVYRVEGLAVSPAFRRQGYGTRLLAAADACVGADGTVWLCVDKDTEHTEWLLEWYGRLGFELAYSDPRLRYGSHEIPMRKQSGCRVASSC